MFAAEVLSPGVVVPQQDASCSPVCSVQVKLTFSELRGPIWPRRDAQVKAYFAVKAPKVLEPSHNTCIIIIFYYHFSSSAEEDPWKTLKGPWVRLGLTRYTAYASYSILISSM